MLNENGSVGVRRYADLNSRFCLVFSRAMVCASPKERLRVEDKPCAKKGV